jgi:AraC-like DNA-binding protein
MIHLNFFQLVWFASFVYGFLLLSVLFLKWKVDPSLKILFWILVIAILSQSILYLRFINRKDLFPIIVGLLFPLKIFLLTLFDLFARAYLKGNDLDRKSKAIFVSANLIGVLWFGWIQWNLYFEKISTSPWRELHWEWENIFQILFLVVLSIFVFCRSKMEMNEFENRLNQAYSSKNPFRLPVLKILWLGLICTTLVLAFDFAVGPNLELWPLLPLVQLVTLFILVQFIILKSPVFQFDLPKIQKEKVGPAELEKIQSLLISIFEEKKLYLNSEIRLSDVANILKVKPYKLSATLGLSMNTNFFDFVNSYRVKHAQELLSQNSHLNILGIAQESGFHSKSVFNDTFKRVTGTTPSEYRRKNSTNS